MKNGMTKQEFADLVTRVREVFSSFDKSRDGTLDMHELSKVFRKLGPQLSSDEISQYCDEVDSSKDGTVTLKEFVLWLKQGGPAAKDVARAIVKETGEARIAKIKATFALYDKSGDGSLDVDEIRTAFKAMGSFTNDEINRVCMDLDKSKDGEVSYQEFEDWIRAPSPTKEIVKAKAILAPTDESGMEGCYFNFCGAGHADMDGKSFLKMCKDCKIVDKNLPETSIDLIFSNTRVKAKGQRCIEFEQFEIALTILAEKKGVSLEEIQQAILAGARPVAKGTKAEANRFHDAKSHGQGDMLRNATSKSVHHRRLAGRHSPKLKLDPNHIVDNSNLWKVFGADTAAGRSLKRIYASSSPKASTLRRTVSLPAISGKAPPQIQCLGGLWGIPPWGELAAAPAMSRSRRFPRRR
eukprot:CAMPEP_0117558356 /NCGR_PEP_ID=MMETSP0784-20121206/52791_1 /TAXON_ID=39447 /ORGANISM="" /LENGTH=409 /DNA_ID=CAMNT_0005355677 /DNA_START=156 /DNA_END=1382 /DNA_ORIENTATION=-